MHYVALVHLNSSETQGRLHACRLVCPDHVGTRRGRVRPSLLERRPRFREVPGLVQKLYGRDRATGDVCGIYLFESNEALEAFRETELARTIPSAYEALDVRREVYEVLYPLWPERGPFVEVEGAASV
jgi:Putative mono-oxygenase ydhR